MIIDMVIAVVVCLAICIVSLAIVGLFAIIIQLIYTEVLRLPWWRSRRN